MKILGYAPGNIPITQEDLDHCQRWIEKYESKAKEQEAKAGQCKPAQRGGHLSQVARFYKSAERMRQNLAAQGVLGRDSKKNKVKFLKRWQLPFSI